MIRIATAGLAALVMALALSSLPRSARAEGAAQAVDAGVMIYRQGMLGSGAPLLGERPGGTSVQGSAAACTNCHKRSGLGGYEGSTVIPPIIGRYLFRTRQVNLNDLGLPHIAGYMPNREAYADDSLAEAIRTGNAPGHRSLSPLMPRYDLPDQDMSALIAYLRRLSTGPQPGVSDTTLEMATIITPDADPAAAEAMLSVMQRFIGTQNQVIAGDVRPMHSNRDIMYRVTRKWHLRIWRLSGGPQEWQEQLEGLQRKEPVFAVLAGIGGRDWRPVHQFCESASVPCLFPNIDLPVVAEADYFPVYWSRGVLLEADLMAMELGAADRAAAGSRVVQVFRKDDIGASAAAALESQMLAAGVTVLDRSPGSPGPAGIAAALSELRPTDRLVFWLRPDDLKGLPARPATVAGTYYSGLMAGLDVAPMPGAWRRIAHMAYPYDLPERRRVRMNFPLGWFRIQHLDVINERVQVNTYMACQIMAEALGHMLDSFVPELLVDRVESMVSTRLDSGYFPRLGLGPGQRFASKGGYLVHFDGPQALDIRADSDWHVPH